MNRTLKQLLFAFLTIILTNWLFSCQSTETIVQHPDTPAAFIGGHDSFVAFVKSETNNSAISAASSDTSSIQVLVTISSNGNITAAEVIQNPASKKLSNEIQTELIHLSENAPAFTPAIHEGKNVASLFVFTYHIK